VLTSLTVAGFKHAAVDIKNLSADDILEIIIRKKVLPTDTLAVGVDDGIVYRDTFTVDNARLIPIVELPPIKSEHEYMLSINQIAGTPRAFNWSVDSP